MNFSAKLPLLLFLSLSAHFAPAYGAQADTAVKTAAASKESSRSFKQALPGYKFSFPRDHFMHEDFKTEWWYYTGHLQAENGEKFGFELTFFRSGVPLLRRVEKGPWRMNNLYMAHFALSDLSGKRFFHDQKLCRESFSQASSFDEKNKPSVFKVNTENWSAEINGRKHSLKAKSDSYLLDLVLDQGKAPVIHGKNGVSQKADMLGAASHYYSLTRMPARGRLVFDGKEFSLSGNAWMDHEFGSNQLGKDQVGWDWFSIQLDDGSEFMLYQMRLKNGSFEKTSSGTFISADGSIEHLPLSSYRIKKLSSWKSPHTGADYPSSWQISIPEKEIELEIIPELADQELVSKESSARINYWEGACKVKANAAGKTISGKAYVELTGYDKRFDKNI